MNFDARSFKRQFPLFSHPENERLVYLDNAATTQRPQPVIDAITDFYSRYNANTHRSSHRLARTATEMVERVRSRTANFLCAARSEEIIFVRGATEGLNLLAHALGEQLRPGDEILLSAAEHHANLVPWQMVAAKRGLHLRFLPSMNGIPQVSALGDAISQRTRVVSITAASNALGCRLDLRQVREQLPEGVQLVVDASQLLAHSPLDVQAVGCDFLVASAHKFYGPTGIGLVYGRSELLQRLDPWQGGGEMIERVELQGSSYAEPPHRFEAGTSALAAIAGMGACIDWLLALDRIAMARYETNLTRYLHTQLQMLEGELPLRLLTRAENNVGIAALVPRSDSSTAAADIGQWLDARDIAVRVGHHCAQPLMHSISEAASVRVSLAAYNVRSDIDRLVEALREMPFGAVERPCPVDSGESFGDDLSALTLYDLQRQRGWQQRYRQLTQWGSLLSRKPQIRIDANRVRGCESEVWMAHRRKGARHRFAIDTDSRVIQGLSVLLLMHIDDRTQAEIARVDMPSLFAELGLDKYLSPSRNNGFRALLERALSLVAASEGSSARQDPA